MQASPVIAHILGREGRFVAAMIAKDTGTTRNWCNVLCLRLEEQGRIKHTEDWYPPEGGRAWKVYRVCTAEG